MIRIIDYGLGNLFSLKSSFASIGVEVEVTSDPELIRDAEKLILPGVGAYRDASNALKESGLGEVVKEEAAKGKPLMGICLGMQMLFDVGYEYGEYEGLGLIPGAVRAIADVIPADLKIPHIGWNSLDITQEAPILKYTKQGDFVYFVHSFYADTDDKYIIAKTEYGADLTAAVRNGNVYGCQFHPEKSEKVGLAILKAFCEL